MTPTENAVEEKVEASRAGLPIWEWLLSGSRPYLILFFFTALFWVRTLSFGFVWDDFFFIENLESIRSLKNTPAILTSLEAQSSYPEGFVLYRPLRTLHYAALVALGGGTAKPALFHLANILWHAAAVALLFACARDLLRRVIAGDQELRADAIAFLLALGFSLHPVVTEVVAWAKSLDDLMATVFVLASLRLLLSNARGGRTLWGALGFFTLALFSKESAAPFAAVAFFVIWLLRGESLKVSFARSALFLAVTVLFLVARHEVIGRTSQTAPISGSYGQTLIDTAPAATKYLRLLFGIPPFAIDYSFMAKGNAWTNPQALGGFLLVVASVFATGWCLSRTKWRMVGFGLAWFGLFMLPVSNLVPMMQFMAERFLYLPLIGWLIALGAIAVHWERAQFVQKFAVLLIAFWAVVAWQRAGIWKDSVSLFVTSVIEGPRSARLEDNAIGAVLRLPHMQRVFQVEPIPTGIPRVSLRNAANTNWTDIVATLDDLSKMFPRHPSVNSAQGVVWALQGRPQQAAEYFKKVTEATPNDPVAWGNLGQALLDAQNVDEARRALDRALELNPDSISALQSLSSLLWHKKDYAAAVPIFERLKKVDPKNPDHAHWAEEARKLSRSPGPGP